MMSKSVRHFLRITYKTKQMYDAVLSITEQIISDTILQVTRLPELKHVEDHGLDVPFRITNYSLPYVPTALVICALHQSAWRHSADEEKPRILNVMHCVVIDELKRRMEMHLFVLFHFSFHFSNHVYKQREYDRNASC